MRKAASIFIIVLTIAVCASLALGNETDPLWTITPGLEVGPISQTADESDLIQLYGKDNVTSLKIAVDNEGMEYQVGTVIYPKDPLKKLSILWSDPKNKKKLKRVELYGDKSYWKLAGGVSLGSSLKDLVRLNGGEFILWGFGWDAGGFVKTWGNGTLEKKFAGKVSIGLDTISRVKKPDTTLVPDNVTKDEYFSVQGDSEFSSSHPIMQKINPTVRQIFVSFEK
jgi:hypothetical protein